MNIGNKLYTKQVLQWINQFMVQHVGVDDIDLASHGDPTSENYRLLQSSPKPKLQFHNRCNSY